MSCRRPKNRLTLPLSLSPDYPEGDDFVSNVIDFLQRLGQDAELRHAPRTALERALTEADIDPALREALLGADQRKLESLLGADTNVCAMISPGKKEEESEDDDEDDEDEEEENSLTPRRSTVRRVG